MGICLNMIVRNESANLPTLFSTLKGHVDFFVIADTGSTDGTPELIEALSKQYGIPGNVTRHAWTDFATNRNLALQDALNARMAGEHHCDWVMILDADEELRIHHPDWRRKLKPGVTYSAMSKGERLSVNRIFLLWLSGMEWTWKGRVHNYLTAGEIYPYQHLNDLYIHIHLFRGAKSKPFLTGMSKADADADLMAEELRGMKPGKPLAHRFFQWAHVLFLSGSIRSAGEIFSTLASDPVIGPGIRYASAILAGRCCMTTGESTVEGERWFDLAFSIDPERREALFYIALATAATDKHKALAMLEKASHIIAPTGAVFYLEHDLYEWRTDHQQILMLTAIGDTDRAVVKARELINRGGIPETEKGFLWQVLQRGMPPHDPNPERS